MIKVYFFCTGSGLDNLPSFAGIIERKLILDIQCDCLKYGIKWNDKTNPFLSATNCIMKKRIHQLNKKINRKKKEKKALVFNKDKYLACINDEERKKYSSILEYEQKIMSLSNMKCYYCHAIFLNYNNGRKKFICQSCLNCHKNNNSTWTAPHWIDGKHIIHDDIPKELQDLRLGEQLLIQKASPYIPVVHIRNGTLGIHGHCISFPQDISSVCNSLPHINCKIVRYIRHFGTQSEGKSSNYDAFLIRKWKVMDALSWLKKYNILYKCDESVVINENNLSWMRGRDEAELEGIIDILENTDKSSDKLYHDGSVSNIQTNTCIPLDKDGQQCLDDNSVQINDLDYSGACVDKPFVCHGNTEKIIVKELQAAVKKSSKKIPAMDFPQVHADPINEYEGFPLFASAFPWLFPGGIGDIYDNNRGETKDIHKWLEKLMRYKDGRFQNDRIFSFYANDFCQRKLANSNGGFFVRQVCGQCPLNMDDLKDQISCGNLSFVNKLQYFSGSIKGTDSYWRRKKHELNAWILYHLEQRHGPPTLFITLSCAEYWWPDLQRLIAERLKKSKNLDHHLLADKILKGDHKSRLKGVNLYTGLVQEFFHKRTEAWLEIVGRKLFNITHFWAAYEFAAGRGQIHMHLLAITDDQYSRLKDYHMLRKNGIDNVIEKTNLMSDYAKKTLKMTSNHPGLQPNNNDKQIKTINKKWHESSKYKWIHALNERYCEIADEIVDQRDLSYCCQIHFCNDFCMRNKSKSSKKKRDFVELVPEKNRHLEFVILQASVYLIKIKLNMIEEDSMH